MVAGLWHPIRDWMARFRWQLAVLAALLVILACVLVIPQWLVRWELGAEAGDVKGADKAKAINDVRTTLLQGIAGAAVLTGVYFTYRQLQTGRDQLQVAQQGQLTERFTRAIDQLGNKESLEVRLGGIRALERIARESSEDHWPIMEVLAAYVRTHASWRERETLKPHGPPSHFRNWMGEDPPEGWPAVKPEPEVQAALTVISRRMLRSGSDEGRFDFSEIDLRGAELPNAVLNRAEFVGAHLTDASLSKARLVRTNFFRAHLEGANLSEAQFIGANLYKAHLDYAFLYKADFSPYLLGEVWLTTTLTDAQLIGAHLQEANLDSANLTGANLSGALLASTVLTGAHLEGADLSSAYLTEARLEGADLSSAKLTGADLTSATFDSHTRWPNGFEPEAQGALRSEAADLAGRRPGPS